LLILSRTRSRGTFVKRDVTSKEINTSVSRTRFFESTLYNSKLFAIQLLFFSRLMEIISCREEDNEYRVVLMEDTMIL